MTIKIIKIMQYFFVYILKCNDQSYYLGHTDNIENRIAEHKSGKIKYTSSRLPIECVLVQAFGSRTEAFNMEQKIKKWSRKKKEALINQDWDELSKLAKKKFKD